MARCGRERSFDQQRRLLALQFAGVVKRKQHTPSHAKGCACRGRKPRNLLRSEHQAEVSWTDGELPL
jgi:hypothetical protein